MARFLTPWLVVLSVIMARLSVAAEAAPSFTVHRLENGLTVLCHPDSTHPIISCAAFIDTGSRTEDEKHSGALHFLEHLVFKGGTRRLAPTEFRKRMSELGQESGGWTSEDAINFGFTTPKRSFVTALDLFAEALLELTFDDRRFEAEKKVVLQELEKYEEQAGWQLSNLFGTSAYVRHPYRRDIGGSRKGVAALTAKELEAYYRARFVPNHLVLSVVGDFQVPRLLAQIKKRFGSYRKGPESFELGLKEPPQDTFRRATRTSVNTEHTKLWLGVATGPGDRAEEGAALSLAAWLVSSAGRGLPSYLTKGSIQWAFSAGAWNLTRRDSGLFVVSVELPDRHTDHVTDWLVKWLGSVDFTRWPRQEFDEVRRSFLASRVFDGETFGQRAIRHGRDYCTMGPEAAARVVATVEALTPEAVQRVFRRYVTPRRLNLAILGPRRGAAPDAAPVKEPAVTRVSKEPEAPPSMDLPGLLKRLAGKPLRYSRGRAHGGVQRFRFSNGLTLLVHPLPDSAVVSISARVLGGQPAEDPTRAGVNYLTSSLLTRGTRRWSRDAWDRLVESLAVEITPRLGPSGSLDLPLQVDYRDSASLHAKATRGQHREALTLVKEALFFPALLPEEIEKARKEQLSALSNLEEDNLEFIKQEFYARLFSGHPYGRPVLGTRETIHAIAPAEVREFHRTHFTADRVVVAVTGPVQPRQVASFIAGRWGDLPRGPGAALASLDPPAQLPHGDQLVKRNRTQWTINFGWPTVAYRDPRRVSVSVLLSMIQHRHFFKYVYQEGVSYRSWFSGWDHRGTGVWIVENDVDRNRFDEIVGKIENDIREYAAGPFTADELTRAKSRMQNSLLLDRQSSLRDTWGLAVAEGNGIGFEEYVRRPAAIDRVSLQMARGLARELFGPGNYLRLVMK